MEICDAHPLELTRTMAARVTSTQAQAASAWTKAMRAGAERQRDIMRLRIMCSVAIAWAMAT
jgi:hypothetical protein